MPNEKRQLTAAAQADRDDFVRYDGCCSCHNNPPCGYCTHPGNPLNQEDDEFYEPTADALRERLHAAESLITAQNTNLLRAESRVKELNTIVMDSCDAIGMNPNDFYYNLSSCIKSRIIQLEAALLAQTCKAWEAGFMLCKSYGDNAMHFDGEQKERQWQKYLQCNPTPTLALMPILSALKRAAIDARQKMTSRA